MSLLAPVGPPKLLLDLKEKGVLGKYHLLLAHDVVAQADAYKEVFDDIENLYVIMDNSLCELGHPVTTEVMLEACKIVPPTTVVLPDYMNKYSETISASSQALFEWRDAGLRSFMGVIQGQNLTEMRKCMQEMSRLPNITAWGVPRCTTYAIGTRWGILQDCIMMNDGRRIHLLGFSDNLRDDVACARLFKVSGIDSAVPVRLGLAGTEIDMNVNEHAPRGNFWETAIEANPQAVDNLKIVRKWIA